MSNAPAEVAKALRDALPNLDYNKLVGEARRQFGIAIAGNAEDAELLLAILRSGGAIPADAKGVVWRHIPGNNPPMPLAKTELVIVIPATEINMQQARDQLAGVSILPVLLPGVTPAEGLTKPTTLVALDEEQVRKVLVPELVERLWERRLPLGRCVPKTRDHIAWLLTQRAARDPKLLLGTVAGAGSGRNGAPTPATATLLIHQAALIVSMAAVYGAGLDDRRALFARVAPHLAPTLLLDGAEAVVSKLAAGFGQDRRLGKWYGPAAAYTLRPTLSATSTFLAGLVARRVFSGNLDRPSVVARTAARTRQLGKRALAGAGQATDMLGVMAGKLIRPDVDAGTDAEEELPRAAEAPDQAQPASEPRAAEHSDAD